MKIDIDWLEELEALIVKATTGCLIMLCWLALTIWALRLCRIL